MRYFVSSETRGSGELSWMLWRSGMNPSKRPTFSHQWTSNGIGSNCDFFHETFGSWWIGGIELTELLFPGFDPVGIVIVFDLGRIFSWKLDLFVLYRRVVDCLNRMPWIYKAIQVLQKVMRTSVQTNFIPCQNGCSTAWPCERSRNTFNSFNNE